MTATLAPRVVAVRGRADGAFAEIADAFARSLARQGRGGLCLAVHVDGEPVVDLVGGDLDSESLVQVFSVSKGVAALAAVHAHASGVLDLDRPLGTSWPAFDRPATANLTTRMILAHTSGIPAVAMPLSLDDLLDGGLDRAVATQDPYWAPGTRLAYGAFTFGALLDGAFRCFVGVPLAAYTAEHLTGPTGAEFWFGAPAATLDRVAPLEFTPPWRTPAEAVAYAGGTAVLDGAFAPVASDPPTFFGDERVIRAGWPAMSGVSSAFALSRLFAAVTGPVDGVRLLDDATVRLLAAEQSRGPDPMLFHGTRFGLGVELPHPQFPLLGAGTFGVQGAGGSAVAVDAARRVSVAVVTTVFPATLGASDAALILISSIRAALDADE